LHRFTATNNAPDIIEDINIAIIEIIIASITKMDNITAINLDIAMIGHIIKLSNNFDCINLEDCS
jgi:hypothetical protein